ncbi:30701_t:CDS:1, partial [Gigaspora margarita]
MSFEITADFFELDNYLHLQVLNEIINLEDGTNCFQNDNVYVVYEDKYEDKDFNI